jgi:TetR/AcrR family transcriptional regulator, ethionamide resistance regulator
VPEPNPVPAVRAGAGEPGTVPLQELLGSRGLSATDGTRDTRAAILNATEELLASRRLDELTVVDVIAAAGISRATFYAYFESKHAAVAARAEHVMEQIHDLWSPWLTAARPDRAGLETLWLQSIALWREHQPLLMAAAEAWRGDGTVSQAWAFLMQRYALSVIRHIEHVRAAGPAPAEPDATTLATLLVWLNESALYLTFATAEARSEDDRRIAETLAAIWLRSIYASCQKRPDAIVLPESARPPRTAPPPQPGARLRRTGNAAVRSAILSATERLLAERPLEELTAVDVIEAAGFSRPTFYMYFESKHAAVATLADEVLGEIYERLWRPAFEEARPGTPPGTVEHFLATIAGWREHRDVIVAAAEGWRTDPEVYQRWGDRMESFVAATAAYIEHAQSTGMATPDPDAETLARLLVWLSETVFYLSLAGLPGGLEDDGQLAAALSAVWLRAVHGQTP